MISLNLQMFGGGGSGSGGKTSTGATNAVSSSAPGHRGIGGGRHMDNNEPQEYAKKKSSLGESVSKITDSDAVYVMYDAHGRELRSAYGRAILKNIKSGSMRYNPRTEKWETSKGMRLIIRRRR